MRADDARQGKVKKTVDPAFSSVQLLKKRKRVIELRLPECIMGI
jgi:hypothetical protein